MNDGDDLFDLALPSSSYAAGGDGSAKARPKFLPKIKGKIKTEQGLTPSASAVSEPTPAVLRKIEEIVDGIERIKKDEVGEAVVGAVADVTMDDVAVGGGDSSSSVPMDVDGRGDGEEDDVVLREIDVFFNPSPIDEDTQLYIMQYPLRPYWRPYELTERCEEVRVKLKRSEVEIDLSLDVDSENYDKDMSGPLRLQKQTLSSSKVPFAAQYAVGILIDDKLHLNPVNAVVQLRPSMEHLSGVQMSKNSVQIMEDRSNFDAKNTAKSLKASSMQGKLPSEATCPSPDEFEPWVSLEYYDMESSPSVRYQQKMVAGVNDPIQFSLQSGDYIDNLCPGTSTGNHESSLLLRRTLLLLPLEERLERWFREGPQVNKFDALKYLAPEYSAEDVLKLLPRFACSVQGLWVSKSSLLYEGNKANGRDMVLYLFSKSPLIPVSELKKRFNNETVLKDVLAPLAVERPLLKDWKLKEDTDSSFIRQYPDIVREHQTALMNRNDELMQMAKEIKNKLKGSAANKFVPDSNKSRHPVNSTIATKGAFHKAVLELFEENKVLSQSIILQKLREKAVHLASLPKEDPRAKIAVAAANGAPFLQTELESILREIAVNIHGVYVLQSGKNTANNPLRRVMIKLFQGKESNGRIKMEEIRQAAQIELNRVIKDTEIRQVVTELCVAVGRGTYALKKGSGNEN